jgi:MFS transporter, FSR family, fosmidomycin resistance protein
MQKKLIALLAAGHMFSDINQGALAALLPFLIASRHFSYATAAGLVFMSNLVSSISQPIFGHLADRGRLAWLVPAGVLCAGIGVSLIPLVPAYWMMLAAVGLNGLGVAAFHPEATLLVNHVSGAKKATAMGMFALGGNLGFAVGPLITTACVLALGFRGGVLLIVPALAYAIVAGTQMTRFTRFTDEARARHAASSTAGRDAWWPFAWLTGTVVFRSIVFFGLNTFLALYWVDVLHRSKAAGNTALSILLLCGALGTAIGGRLADAIGNGRVLAGALLLVPVLLIALVNTDRVPVATAILVPLGMLLSAPFGVMVLMGQQYLPNHPGAASGVTLGLAASIGGIVTPLFGRVADHYGLHTSLSGLIFVSLVAFAFAAGTVRASRSWNARRARTQMAAADA